MSFSFSYSREFERMIHVMHEGKQGLSSHDEYIAAHLGGSSGRLSRFLESEITEIEMQCGPIEHSPILDFGCGTGDTTAALAIKAKEVVAFDIDSDSLQICAQRLEEHELSNKVTILHGEDIDEIVDRIGTFDLVICHAVIEHIPRTNKGLRRRLITSIFNHLNVGGHL